MKERVFRFKEFTIAHGRSSMPIGVDAVLLGSWCQTVGNKIIDVGTGCGVIALMVASRFPKSQVLGVDIDAQSVDEACFNFINSPWKDRVTGRLEDWSKMYIEDCWDLIVSNPPYYQSGVNPNDNIRMQARHKGTLSPESLIERGVGMLSAKGRIAMIVPADQENILIALANSRGLHANRIMEVSYFDSSPIKRVLLEFILDMKEVDRERLIMFNENGEPTERYRQLTGRFYLKF